jgi:hypothetical protein
MRSFVFRYNPKEEEGIKRKEKYLLFPACFQEQKWTKLPGSESSVCVDIESQNYLLGIGDKSYPLKSLIYQDKSKKLVLVTKEPSKSQKLKKLICDSSLAFVCENCNLKSNSLQSLRLETASYFNANGIPKIKKNNKIASISTFGISKKDKIA